LLPFHQAQYASAGTLISAAKVHQSVKFAIVFHSTAITQALTLLIVVSDACQRSSVHNTVVFQALSTLNLSAPHTCAFINAFAQLPVVVSVGFINNALYQAVED